MKDPEFIRLRNNFILIVGIFILFAIPIYFVIKNKILPNESKILEQIKDKQDIVLLVVSDDCTSCNKYSKYLKELNVDYTILNINKEEDYKIVLNKMKISSNDVIPPTLIYAKKGIHYSSLVDIKNKKELEEYIKNYKLNE